MTDSNDGCIFCGIIRKKVPAFVVYEDKQCIAFLDLRPVRSGHTMVIPKQHVDHFTDLDDDLAKHILGIAQCIARRIRDVLNPPRVGYVVAGFGVPHAHLHVQPMWEDHDITSQRYLDISQTPPAFNMQAVAIPPENEQKKIQEMIRINGYQ